MDIRRVKQCVTQCFTQKVVIQRVKIGKMRIRIVLRKKRWSYEMRAQNKMRIRIVLRMQKVVIRMRKMNALREKNA